jgi:azurin
MQFMKSKPNTITSLLLFCSIVLLQISCGSSENKTQEIEDSNTFNRPVYDVSNIDTSAPVVELTVLAQGQDMSQMSFDMKSMEVSAGTTVKLIVKSTSPDASMPHNWVLVHKGTMESVAKAGLDAGRDNGFVPNSPDVLVKSKLLGPNESDTIIFPAPPIGTYEFVCTYPGHWSIMNGTFTVK